MADQVGHDKKKRDGIKPPRFLFRPGDFVKYILYICKVYGHKLYGHKLYKY